MLTEQVFHFLYLYFDASAAYHIVLPALDAEEDVRGRGFQGRGCIR